MRRKNEKGIALLLALLVLVILAVVILQMSASSLHNRTLAENHLSDLQNTYGARAGYARALLFLQADLEQAPDVDSLQERWAAPFEFDLGKAHVRVSIIDSDRFINLSQLTNDKGEVNAVVAAQLRRLVKVLHHTPDIADRIIDYVDADSKGEFEAGAKNERLCNLDELLRIDGLTPEIVYGGLVQGEQKQGLRGFLTVWPVQSADANAPTGGANASIGVVNINTAPSEVLQSLSDQMTPGIAEAIVAYRTQLDSEGKPQQFKTTDDVKHVQGMNDGIFTSLSGQIAVKSSTFEIRARGTVGQIDKTWVYVVQRKSSSTAGPIPAAPPTPPVPSTNGPTPSAPTAKHVLIASQALNDFVSSKPSDEDR